MAYIWSLINLWRRFLDGLPLVLIGEKYLMYRKRLEIYKKNKSVFWKMFLFRLSILMLLNILFVGGLFLLLKFDLNPLLLFIEIIPITLICFFYWGLYKTSVFLWIYRGIRYNERFLLKEFVRREKILLRNDEFLKRFEKIPKSKYNEFKQAIISVEKIKEIPTNDFKTYSPRKKQNRLKPIVSKVIFGLISVAFIVGVIYMGSVANKSRQKARDMVINYGTEVNGRLIYKYSSRSNNIDHFTIHFDFVHNDSLIQVESQSFDFDNDDFNKAIIGMKYKALVILDGESKYEYTKILLEKPILESFNEVENERIDIASRYKSAPSLIKKYGRSGKELEKIWNKYYKN